MPPRGYISRGAKPTIGAQINTLKKKLTNSSDGTNDVKKAIVQLLDAHDPDITNNSALQKQRIPDGWEPVTSIPDWATAGTRPEIKDPNNKWEAYNADRKTHKERINPKTLSHAIRLKGTNHIFTSEVKLTEVQLERAAADYKQATNAIGHMFPDGVAMHVPTASNFASRDARGYMRMSEGKRRTFYMSPKVIKRDAAAEQLYRERQDFMRQWNWKPAKIRAEAAGQPAPDKNDSSFGWSMPASTQHNGAVYTMVHEMAHVLDDINSHTGVRGQASRSNATRAAEFHRSKKHRLSEYGRSKIVEGYAEAGAQWFLGGPGTSDVADDYANEYGWRR